MREGFTWLYRGIILILIGWTLNVATGTYNEFVNIRMKIANQDVINKIHEQNDASLATSISANTQNDNTRYIELVNKINAVPSELFTNNPYFKPPKRGQP